VQVIVRLKAEMVLWTFKPKLSLEINRGKINTYECLHVEQVLSTPVLRNLSYWNCDILSRISSKEIHQHEQVIDISDLKLP
jgi:hypothetical protein